MKRTTHTRHRTTPSEKSGMVFDIKGDFIQKLLVGMLLAPWDSAPTVKAPSAQPKQTPPQEHHQ
jgi:hypothetical protein